MLSTWNPFALRAKEFKELAVTGKSMFGLRSVTALLLVGTGQGTESHDPRFLLNLADTPLRQQLPQPYRSVLRHIEHVSWTSRFIVVKDKAPVDVPFENALKLVADPSGAMLLV